MMKVCVSHNMAVVSKKEWKNKRIRMLSCFSGNRTVLFLHLDRWIFFQLPRSMAQKNILTKIIEKCVKIYHKFVIIEQRSNDPTKGQTFLFLSGEDPVPKQALNGLFMKLSLPLKRFDLFLHLCRKQGSRSADNGGAMCKSPICLL